MKWTYLKGGFIENDICAQRSYLGIAFGKRLQIVFSWYPLEVHL